jgi:hypothetical protein
MNKELFDKRCLRVLKSIDWNDEYRPPIDGKFVPFYWLEWRLNDCDFNEKEAIVEYLKHEEVFKRCDMDLYLIMNDGSRAETGDSQSHIRLTGKGIKMLHDLENKQNIDRGNVTNIQNNIVGEGHIDIKENSVGSIIRKNIDEKPKGYFRELLTGFWSSITASWVFARMFSP